MKTYLFLAVSILIAASCSKKSEYKNLLLPVPQKTIPGGGYANFSEPFNIQFPDNIPGEKKSLIMDELESAGFELADNSDFQIRFCLAEEPVGQYEGWYIDNIKLEVQ